MLRRLTIPLLILPLTLLCGCTPLGLRVPWGLSRLPWTVLHVTPQNQVLAHGLSRPLVDKASPGYVAPSPTGAHLAAVDENGVLSIVPTVAGDPVVIDQGVVETAFWPELSPWSADGRALVYVSRGDLTYYRLGRHPRQLTTTKDAFSPALSPDGSLVAFGRKTDNDQDLGLWVMPVTGGEPTQLVDATGDIFGACCPVWSPDQQWIAFLQAYEGGALGVVKADGSQNNVGIEAAWMPLLWSPDSATVSFPKVYYGESGDGLWRYTVSSQTSERVAAEKLNAEPAVSPDYTRAVLALAPSPVEGKQPKTTLVQYTLPQWQKGSTLTTLPGQPLRALYSPDGAQLAVLTVADTAFALHLGTTGGDLKKIAASEELAGWVRLPKSK